MACRHTPPRVPVPLTRCESITDVAVVASLPPPPRVPLLPCAESRLFAGLHFRFSNEDGAKLGKLVAGKVFERFQQPAAKGAASKAAVASEKGAAAGRRLLA